MKKDKVKEAVEDFVYKVSMEGLDYAVLNYPPDKDAPKDLRKAVDTAIEAISQVKGLLAKYMEKYDIEYS